MERLRINNFWYNRRVIILVMTMAFVMSLLMFFFDQTRKRRILLFFPGDNRIDVEGDYHIVPLKNSDEDNMEVLLSEALLEPMNYRLNETVPSGTIINSFIYDKENQVVYIDLSLEMAVNENDSHLGMDGKKMLKILEKNLRFNYPKLEKVLFTIDGHVPYASFFDGAK